MFQEQAVSYKITENKLIFDVININSGNKYAGLNIKQWTLKCIIKNSEV
jgi:hypothetical protein